MLLVKFLSNLRTNRPTRPSGSRPLPSERLATAIPTSVPERTTIDFKAPNRTDKSSLQGNSGEVSAPERSLSAFSHRRAQSVFGSDSLRGGRPLVHEPQVSGDERECSITTMKSVQPRASVAIPYSERGDRWMEKQEAKSLRIALEDMDLMEEQRIYNAAQDEATELVKQHQDPQAKHDAFAPYAYRAHLRKGSYVSPTSVKRYGSITMEANAEGELSTSVGSTTKHSDCSVSQTSHRSSSSTSRLRVSCDGEVNPKKPNSEPPGDLASQKIESFGFPVPGIKPFGRRRSSGVGRASGGVSPGSFRNPDDMIYEQPETASAMINPSIIEEAKGTPLVVTSRNASGKRAAATKSRFCPQAQVDLEASQQLSRREIHKNPPSQSRDPLYTKNIPTVSDPITRYENTIESNVPKKNGIEIRSDEIRAATSLKLKDRSPKLPTPSIVSNRLGRPIVSFDPKYKAKQERLKQEQNALQKPNENGLARTLPLLPKKPSLPASTASMPVIPTIIVPEPLSVHVNGKSMTEANNRLSSQINHASSMKVNDSPPIPTINVSETPSMPSISISETPSIAISKPSKHRKVAPGMNSSSRPLPYHFSTAPLPLPRSHWTPTSLRATAQCSACALPIAGRIVSAASQRFHPACFSCFACGELLECIAFYPEPETFRSARLARIQARLKDFPLPEAEAHISEQEDGDDGLRFYCHLDFHEKFSPRCRSCKTPIEGEVIVACGGEWHVGHFFCAECGNPFDASMPFVEKDGYAWCVDCHSRRFSGKCAGCRKAIEEMVVKALGREWHEGCFCCKVCLKVSIRSLHPRILGGWQYSLTDQGI